MTQADRPAENAAHALLVPAMLLVASAFVFPSAAQAASPIEGAWAEQSQACDEVFAFKNGNATFREPVNIFAPAIIITGKTLRTPQASCSVKTVASAGDRTLVTLRCANSVSHSDVVVQLAKLPDGRLVRFYDKNDQSGSRYTLCPVK